MSKNGRILQFIREISESGCLEVRGKEKYNEKKGGKSEETGNIPSKTS